LSVESDNNFKYGREHSSKVKFSEKLILGKWNVIDSCNEWHISGYWGYCYGFETVEAIVFGYARRKIRSTNTQNN
jgi:hypothetical protein